MDWERETFLVWSALQVWDLVWLQASKWVLNNIDRVDPFFGLRFKSFDGKLLVCFEP